MSHKAITVGGQSPDLTGNITVDLNSLNDVAISSASSGEVLKKATSGWTSGAIPAGTAQYLLIGQGSSDAYNHSTATAIAAGSYIQLYDTSPLNTLGATLTTSSNWISSITLAAGEYLIQSSIRPSFAGSGYAAFNICDTSNNTILSNSAIIGEASYSYATGLASTLQGYLSLTSSTTIGVRLLAALNTNTVANQGTQLSTDSFLLIIKI
jgi:hypothetical protein